MRIRRASWICGATLALSLAGQAPSVDTLATECRALITKGDMRGAIQKAQGAVQQNPVAALPHAVLSEVLIGSLPWVKPDMIPKFRQGAKAEALKALAIDPVQPSALESLRILDGRSHGVASIVPAALMLRVDQAEAQLRGGHPELAGPAFEELSKAAPGLAEVESYAGDAWVAAGKDDLAIQAYQRAIKDKPDCGPALRGMGAAYARQGHLEDARNLLEQAIQSDPLDRYAWDAYEMVEKQGGRSLTHLSLPLWAIAKFPGKGQVEWMAQLQENRTDYKFWEEYRISTVVGMGMYKAKARNALGAMVHTSEFEVSLSAWSGAARVQGLPSKDDPSQDALIPWIQKFGRANQLAPAVFLLFFDPRWAGEYQAWLKSNPGEIHKFLRTYAVRPDFP